MTPEQRAEAAADMRKAKEDAHRAFWAKVPATLLHPMGIMGEEVIVRAEPRFWEHFCSDGGLTGTEAGSACPWCRATERPRTRGVHGSEPWDHAAGECS